jgi:PBSX family phage terminase large subunit
VGLKGTCLAVGFKPSSHVRIFAEVCFSFFLLALATLKGFHMRDVIYRPHKYQQKFHKSRARIRGAFAGRRAGKSEAGAIEAIVFAENKIGYKQSNIDPYLGVIIAPTTDMLRRLSLQKLKAYAGNMIVEHHETHGEITWHNGTKILAISADKPQRLEGIKANFIWVDESLQVKEQLFLESMARVSDTQGYIWCTGSLGVNFTNPKNHWAWKKFIDNPINGVEVFQWTTADNSYFPRDELERLKDTLDPRTYKQMFEISWDTPGTNTVYDEFSEINQIKSYVYDSKFPTYCVIDWGFAHPMACLFIQYDPILDRVYVFDEIVKSKLKIEGLYNLIMSRGYNITQWICDIAGNQEREQTGISNVEWFKSKGIKFTYRTSAITHGISIVRSYIRNMKGVSRLFIDQDRCPKTLDGMLNYSYPEKQGAIVSENPLKQNDDAVDALRYYFVLKHDSLLTANPVQMIKR